MVFSQLLNFEIRYQLRQKAFLSFCIIFLAFGFLLGSQNNTPAQINFNSSYQLFYKIGLLSLGSQFAIMFFTISGILRDRQFRMEEIIYTTPISKTSFFFSRFSGILLSSIIVFSMSLVGFALGMQSPELDPGRVSAFQFGDYAWVWLMMALPNVLVCSTLVFSVSSITKNHIATFASAIFIYAAYFLAANFLNSPLMANSVNPSAQTLAIAAVADPFGLSAFFEQTQYWTPFEKNNFSISFSGYFRWNRLIWLSISFIILFVTFRLFSFRKIKHQIGKKSKPEENAYKEYQYQTLNGLNFYSFSYWKSFKSLFKLELTSVFKSLPFIGILLVWIVIIFTEIYSRIYSGGAYNDSLYPSTDILIWLIKDPLPVIGLILVVYYSGEIIWRDYALKFNEIIAATPTPNSLFFLSKLAAFLLLPILLIATSIVMAMGFQLVKGYDEFELFQYLSMFYFQGFGFVFYTSLAFFIQSLSPNKYAGMIITGLIIALFGSPLTSLIGIDHPLLKIGRLPTVELSNMAGYGDFSYPFHFFALYWTSVGLILALLSFKVWQRGTTNQLKFKMKQLWFAKTPLLNVFLGISGLVFTGMGSLIYYNTNVLNDYQTRSEKLDFQEGYEKKFKRYETLQRLAKNDLKTQMDIYPEKGKYVFQGKYILENISDRPIDTILISEREKITSIAIENAQLIEHDSIFNTFLYAFNSPISPNQKVAFSFKIDKKKKGFEIDKTLTRNGSFILLQDFEPVLGYRKSLEIKDRFEREKRGLPARLEEPKSDEHMLFDQSRNYKKVNFETLVSTSTDQVAIAPGDLIDKWSSNGRNYFQYKTPVRIVPIIGYESARYARQTKEYKGILIEQCFHPTHDENIARIFQSSEWALDYCIKNFGKYPFEQVRVVEIPNYWPFGGHAQPGTITMVEDNLYLIDNSNPGGFDLVAKRTIHEVAHQWFGHLLAPKSVEGGSLFTEGFAKYTEAVVMDKQFGKKAVWQLSESAQERYFKGRAFASEPEPPLYFSNGENYLSYGKNFTVMLALRDLIGEEKVNHVIKILLERHRKNPIPNVTALEFLEEIYKTTSPADHDLINDWFKRVITYRLKIENVAIQALGNQRYEVKFTVFAKRFEVENGEEKEIPINEAIPIGLFSVHPNQVKDPNAIITLTPHKIKKNVTDISLIVDTYPKFISIDPFGTRIDKNRRDNVFEIEIQ
ncbi:M1 family aminopeptidase [Flexithrix dorotheae]|uniref:M1 family aminopeptidase n=1 Tax=Flexithrix dorotheae TaxID=70993 RepID=UPI0003692F32|nr:M1 family aminopeptidase [Flexithrix dorotheae]